MSRAPAIGPVRRRTVFCEHLIPARECRIVGCAPPLTPRMLEVVALLAAGLRNDQIADELGLAHNTVHNYVGRIQDRLGLHSRVELAVWWVRSERP